MPKSTLPDLPESLFRSARDVIDNSKKQLVGIGCISDEDLAASLPSEKQVKMILRDAIKSIKFLNFLMAKMKLPFRFDAAALKRKLDGSIDSADLDRFAPIVDRKFKGVLTKEHLCTISVFLRSYYANPHDDHCLWGSMQSAKTIIMAFLIICLSATEWLTKHKTLLPIFWVPNSLNLMEGASGELNTLLNVYRDVEVTCHGNSTTFARLQGVLREIGRHSEKPKIFDLRDIILQRNEQNITKFVDVHGSECITLLMFDEIHNGSNIRGIMDRVNQTWDAKQKGLRRSVGITATPSELFYHKGWQIIPLFLSSTYLGLVKYNGFSLPTLDPKAVISPPRCMPIEAAFPEIGEYVTKYGRDFENVYEDEARFFHANSDSILTKSEHRSYRTRQYAQLPQDLKVLVRAAHIQFRRAFAQAVASVYKKLASDESPIIFFRPFRKKVNCNSLHTELQLLLDTKQYDVMPYYGVLPSQFRNSTRSLTLKEVLVDYYVRRRVKCLILACSGRARMGDSFPRECKFYIDLYEVSVTWNTIMQATFGRACGIGKESICYFRDAYCDALNRFIQRGCIAATSRELRFARWIGKKVKEFGGRDKLHDKTSKNNSQTRGGGRPPSTITFSFDENSLVKMNWKNHE